MHVRKKSQAFELTPGQTLLISILEKLNYLRGSIGLCENHRRLARFWIYPNVISNQPD